MKKIIFLLAAIIMVVLVILCWGTGTTPSAQPPPATTTVVTAPPAATTPEPTPTPDPYPDASALNTPVAFGSGAKTGEINVYGYTVRPTFAWVDPSWNSPKEQAESQGAFETQKGYNTEHPAEGNTFVFIYLSVGATGTESVWAPSPNQIVFYSNGQTYKYTSVGSAQTVISDETGNQYDFELGTGGTGGYVMPGKSNNVKGFLIYEVPESFSPETAYVIVTPDARTQGVWKLA